MAARLTGKQRSSKAAAFDCIQDEVNDLPADFDKWMHGSFDRLIFYHKNGERDYTGYCVCGATISLKKAQTGRCVTCPECGEKGRLREDVFNNYSVELGQKVFAYLQRTSEGWMQRLFVTWKTVSYFEESHKIVERYHMQEDERDHLDADGLYWEFHPKQTDGTWALGPGRIHGQGWGGWRAQQMDIYTYPNNLEKLFSNSKYKYSQIQTAAKHSLINPFHYLCTYLDYPQQMERIYKVGLYKLGSELNGHGDYWYSGLARKIANATLRDLGISNKSDLEEAVRLNLGYKELRARKRMLSWRIPDELRAEAIRFMQTINDASGDDFEYSFISNERLFAYWLTQKKSYKTISDFFRDYSDYISNAIYLKMDVNDTKVKTPKDFRYCDRIVTARANEKRERQRKVAKQRKARSLKKLLQKLSEQLSYSDSKYAVVVPLSEDDLKAEGENQHNCVYGYVDRILARLSIVVFVRHANSPDKSYCTVELQPQTFEVVQCRAAHNNAPPQAVTEWVDKYAARIRRQQQKRSA